MRTVRPWREALGQFTQVAWLAGTALIIASWFNLVPNQVGWVGFFVACGAAFVSYLPAKRGTGSTQADWAFLTKAMVDARDHGYDVAVDRIRNGGTVHYEAISFSIPAPGGSVHVIAPASRPADEVDEIAVQRLVSTVTETLRALSGRAPEFAESLLDKPIRITIVSEPGDGATVICEYVDGTILWKSRSA